MPGSISPGDKAAWSSQEPCGPQVVSEEKSLRFCENRSSSTGSSFCFLSGRRGGSEEAAGNHRWPLVSTPGLTRADMPWWELHSLPMSGQTSPVPHSTLCSQNSNRSQDPFLTQVGIFNQRLLVNRTRKLSLEKARM